MASTSTSVSEAPTVQDAFYRDDAEASTFGTMMLFADFAPVAPLDLFAEAKELSPEPAEPPALSSAPTFSTDFTNFESDSDPWVTVDTLGTIPTSVGEDRDSSVYDFFAEDDGTSLLSMFEGDKFPRPLTICTNRPLTVATSRSRLSRHIRVFSAHTTDTIVQYGAVVLSLSQLCDVIESSRSLSRARIASTEGYAERLNAITHRFLVLELRRDGRMPVWLRVDRRLGKDTSTFTLLRSGGSTPANDVAQFAATKEDIVGDARLENRQVFDTVPTLGEFQHLLRVIIEEMQTYQVWPANCWFFCSLLQQHLEGANEGRFIDGSLHYANLARKIRNRIKERLRLFYHIPVQLTLTSLLESFQTGTIALSPVQSSVTVALSLSTKWDALRERNTTKGRRLASALGQSLVPVAAFFYVMNYHLEERLIWEQRITLFRGLLIQDPGSQRYASELADTLFNYAVCLHHLRRLADACAAHEEAIALRRQLVLRDPSGHRPVAHLALALHNYGITLGEAGRASDTLTIEREAVTTWRQLYHRDPSKLNYRATLTKSLFNYGLSLADLDKGAFGYLNRLEEACTVMEECISLCRRAQLDAEHFDAYREDKHGIELAKVLHAYGWVLHNYRRYEEACHVEEEAVSLFRASGVPTFRRADLAAALHNYGASLQHAGQIEAACSAYSEAIFLRRQDYDRDPNYFGDLLAHSLNDYELCLSQQQAAKTSQTGKAAQEIVV